MRHYHNRDWESIYLDPEIKYADRCAALIKHCQSLSRKAAYQTMREEKDRPPFADDLSVQLYMITATKLYLTEKDALDYAKSLGENKRFAHNPEFQILFTYLLKAVDGPEAAQKYLSNLVEQTPFMRCVDLHVLLLQSKIKNNQAAAAWDDGKNLLQKGKAFTNNAALQDLLVQLAWEKRHYTSSQRAASEVYGLLKTWPNNPDFPVALLQSVFVMAQTGQHSKLAHFVQQKLKPQQYRHLIIDTSKDDCYRIAVAVCGPARANPDHTIFHAQPVNGNAAAAIGARCVYEPV